VRVAFDTSAAGELKGDVTVRCANETATVPVHAVVQRAAPGGSRVLVVEGPFEASATQDPSLLDAWRRLVDDGRLDVDYLVPDRTSPVVDVAALARADTVLIAERGLVKLQEGDVQRLHGFVCGGGRLVVAADKFFDATVAGANRLVEPFGLQMLDAELPGGAPVASGDGDLRRHALLAGVDGVAAQRATPVRIVDSGRARVLVGLPGLGDHAFVALAETRSGGEVVVVGTSLYWHWITKAPGNERLLRNLLTRAPRLK